jgi:diguanylate cyclase (GGDEF)-like protein
MPGVRLARAVVAVAVGAYIVSLIPGVRPQAGFSEFWDVGVYVAVLLGSSAVCGLRAVRVRTDRAAWAFIAVGLASYAAGTLIYNNYLQHWSSVPYPSVSDGLWLSLYPLVIVGIGLMIRARMAGSVASMWLDGLVSGLGLASMSAAIVFPRVTQGASGPPAAIITNFAYPLLDLALVATVVGAMAALGAWRQRAWMLLGAGFLVFSGADSWFLVQLADDSYQSGSAVDACYLVAAALVAMAAGVTKDTAIDEPRAWRMQTRSFLVPGCFALLAIAVLAIGAAQARTTALGVALAVGALTAAWARTSLAVREVVQLSDSRRQALTDALTGLPNRRAFYKILEAAEAATPPAGQTGVASVILTDLDGFKEINDALGHQLGDQLLREVSQRFAANVPPGGSIARLGGDEMALFVPGMSAAEAGVLSQRLLNTLEEPFTIQGTSLHLGASIGITAVEPGAVASRALAKADLAMYRAKAAHSGWEIYDDQRDGDAWDRLATVEALREALTSGGLTVEFQPITALSPIRPTGMEALVRWTHPTRGRVAPDAFLPLAEKAGLMPALTRTVLDLSLDEAQALRRLGWRIPVSVNLSASDLLDNNLVHYVATALEERGLPGDALRLEITESLLVDTAGPAGALLYRLRELDVDLAVDDYGTGYSCMAYLHDLPVSYLKIDRGFTDRVLKDDRTAVIVASTIEMAHGLNLKVVAEGVETTDQLDWLHAHGCDLVQGFHIGRPMPSDRMRAWLAEYAPERPLAAGVAAGVADGP